MDLLNSTLGAVGQVGEALDKYTGGRAVRGAVAGKPRELASIVPFSDTMGLTNHADATSGRDLTDMYGLTNKGSNSFGSHAAGFVADNLLSPTNWLGAGAAFKAAPTIAKGITSGAKALTGLDLVDHIAGGARKLGNFVAGDAGALKVPPPHYAGALPVDVPRMNATAKAANASRPRRYSELPEKANWYAADRNARFGKRFGSGPGNTAVPGGIPEFNLNDAIQRFAQDESGSVKLHMPKSMAEDLASRTDNPLGRLASLSDSAGTKVHIPHSFDDWVSSFGGIGSGGDNLRNAFAVYDPSTKSIVPNTHNYDSLWSHQPSMWRVADQNAASGHFSSRMADHISVHEIGHALHHAESPVPNGTNFFSNLKRDNPLSDKEKGLIELRLSKYGATNPSEFVAEAFARQSHKMAKGADGPGSLPASLVTRYANLGGPTPPASLVDRIRQFMSGDSGYLRHEIPGVDPDLANAMDGLGPQYPGGVQKLHDAINSGSSEPHGIGTSNSTSGASIRDAFSGGGDISKRVSMLAQSQHGPGVASEIPEGSKFLGAGAEGMTFRTPEGSVIRVGDYPNQSNRPELPEMLQAYREARYGPYKVEHMPQVAPVFREFDDPIKRAGRGEYTPELADAINANNRINDHHTGVASQLQKRLDESGVDPWDVTHWNAGMTPEGNAIIFDGGAVRSLADRDLSYGKITPEQARSMSDPRFAPKPSYGVPEGDMLQRVLAEQGPELVRESLRHGAHMGTVGQGVQTPWMSRVLDDRDRVQAYLRQSGIDPGIVAGWRGDTPAPAPQYAAAGQAPSLGKLYGTMAAAGGGGALLAYLLSGQHQGK